MQVIVFFASHCLPRSLHRRSVSVVGVAADLSHVLRHVVDRRHQVAGRVRSKQIFFQN